MRYTQTIDAPVSVVVDEPTDELTQAELERLIRLARSVKRRAVGHVTIDLSPVNGLLWIVGYKRAA